MMEANYSKNSAQAIAKIGKDSVVKDSGVTVVFKTAPSSRSQNQKD
jgi:hypothetical protein